MIKEFVEYIEDNTDFTVGTDLFAISVDSDQIDECVVVREDSPGLVHGTMTDYRQLPLRAYARATTRFTARDNAYTVFDLLHGKMQFDLPIIDDGYTYTCNCECRSPYYMGLDESGRRHVYVVAIDLTITNMT
uniref:Tail protein n=1 Tax=viral metagenome TaxID=1070528 RepID=A0A6M3M5J1_9ZZZZ